MMPDSSTVVVLRGNLTRPHGWGDETGRHVLVDDVEEVDGGEAYRLERSAAPESWVLSKQNVEAVRPPDHPGHPDNL